MPDIALAWYWLAGGLLLMMVEIFAPGAFLLWLGLAATATGIILLALPGLSLEMQGVSFAALALVSIVAGRAVYRRNLEATDHPMLNRRVEQFIGQTYILASDVVDGRAAIRAGDTTWNVTVRDGAGLRAGDHVKVIGSDGTILVAEPLRR